jgi:O-antigen chain-terminating methyltransferase
LRDVLGGVSPDYAVVAQKPADDALIACSSDAFAQEYGLTLDALAARFDQQTLQASECAASAQIEARQASECAASAATLAQQASERAATSESALIAVLHSSSWRLTAPLRSIGRKVKSLFQLSEAVNSKIKEKIRLLLLRAALGINGRNRLKKAALLVLAPFPALKARLKMAALKASFAQGAAPAASKDLAHLTPRARQIYADLKVAIARQQKENS